MKASREKTHKPLLVKILQWLYLIFAILSLAAIFLYPQFTLLSGLGFPRELIIGSFLALAIYCLILSLSFFLQNTTLLIISLVLIFFTTIGAIAMMGVSIPNSKEVLAGNLPSCVKNLALCNLKEGLIVASAGLLAVSVPTLLLNILTIVGAVKGIAAAD
ncbi:MAG TPA: hypothetical protein VLE47_01260 [Candidatus Saccharimonadales bacterium]|nr:hypothetical protein [Candidatus Saccharimonadales bacterium]